MQGDKAVAGVPGGPYCKLTTPKTCVKKAERALRLFYFEKKYVRFFKNKNNKLRFVYANYGCSPYLSLQLGIFTLI